jgi:predicted exporter
VGLSAASTVLSFGLLGVSTTPALRTFGVTMLIGVTVAVLAAPYFCTDASEPH